MAVKITCYDGVNTIGGNKILVEDEERDTSLFLDFGMSFSRRAKFFEEYLKPRPGVGLRDPVRLGLLPPLEGIYRSDLVAALSAEDYGYIHSRRHYRHFHGEPLAGVYLSHAHLDHSGYISFLKEDLPIYCTAMTAAIAKVVEDVGQSGDLEREVCYFSRRELVNGVLKVAREEGHSADYLARPFVIIDESGFLDSRFWKESPAGRKGIRPQRVALPVDRMGNLLVRVFPVDHSIYGATGCAVETSAGWVVYTGDLRLHGSRRYLTESFVAEVAELEPVALLCEGTRIDSPGRAVTEEQVRAAVYEAVRQAKGLVIADFGARNIERLLTFREVAAVVDRQLAISPADAYLLNAMRQADPSLPDVKEDPVVAIYADVKSAPRPWEQRVREEYKTKIVRADQVRRNLRSYILAFSFFDINDLVDIDPKEAVYIYSSSEAFNEELVIDAQRLKNWLDEFGISLLGSPLARQGQLPFIQRLQKWLDYFHIPFLGNPLDSDQRSPLHASGHASGPDLLDLVRRIRPQMLIPIHTEHPELFAVLEEEGIHVHRPQVGVPIVLK